MSKTSCSDCGPLVACIEDIGLHVVRYIHVATLHFMSPDPGESLGSGKQGGILLLPGDREAF